MANRGVLKTIVLEGTGQGPHVLITGGVHGDEFEPMAALRRLAMELPPDALSGKLTLVPVVNEGAFLRGQRMADDELDLARVCPGDPQGTVTQRTAHQLSQLIRAADYYIDLHTGGTKWSLFPLCGYMLHADPTIQQQQHDMARAFNLPLVWGTDPTLNGRSLSVARDAHIPAIYAEYQGAAVCSPQGIAALVDGCLNVLAKVGMLDRSPPLSRVEYDIQDPGPQSGFLQHAHPSPCDGFFETAVGLGGQRESGQPLGWVTDSLGQHRIAVPAERTGIVICLRTFPAVRKNDSLGYLEKTG